MALVLTPAARSAFTRLGADFTRVFGDRFVALVAYGPRSSVAFTRSLEPSDIDALSVLVESWRRDGIDTPLVMTPDEFVRSLDAFPLEYQAILDAHEVIAGHAPFDGVRVDDEDLRRACEVQAKSHLIHLRQGWLQTHGHPAKVAELLHRSAAPFRVLLSHVARLSAEPSSDADALASFAHTRAGLDREVVRHVLALEHSTAKRPEIPGGMAAYVRAADQLWRFVDTWRG